MKINAILLSQFNDKSGFRMIYAYPNDVISNNQFSLYSQLILAREQICGRMIAIQYMRQYILLGVPNISYNRQNKVYKRAKFIYSINVLIEKKQYLAYMKKYKQMGKKLAYFFRFIQQSSNAIYYNMDNISYLQKLLQKIFTEINSKKPCVISHLSSSYTIVDISINFSQEYQQHNKIKIKPYHIPVTKIKEQQIKQIQSQFGRNLLKFALTGDYNMKKICEICQMQQKQIKKFYSKAIQIGLVFLVDMFSLHNRYALTQKFLNYLPECQKYQELQEICKQISLNKNNILKSSQLLSIYFTISRNCSLKNIIDAHLKKFKKINIIKWVRLSQILGIFTRVYQKFALIQPNQQPQQPIIFITEELIHKLLLPKQKKHSQILKAQHRRLNIIFESHLKNKNTIDQICIDLNIERSILMKLLNYNQLNSLKIFYVIQDS